MKVRVLFVVALLLVASSVAYSQGATGVWKGERAGLGGGPAQEITLDITVEGTTVTGTWTQGEEATEEVTEGMLEGTTVMFKRMFTGDVVGEVEMSYTGEIEGDEMTLTVSFEGFEGGGGGGGVPPLVLTRQ